MLPLTWLALHRLLWLLRGLPGSFEMVVLLQQCACSSVGLFGRHTQPRGRLGRSPLHGAHQGEPTAVRQAAVHGVVWRGVSLQAVPAVCFESCLGACLGVQPGRSLGRRTGTSQSACVDAAVSVCRASSGSQRTGCIPLGLLAAVLCKLRLGTCSGGQQSGLRHGPHN